MLVQVVIHPGQELIFVLVIGKAVISDAVTAVGSGSRARIFTLAGAKLQSGIWLFGKGTPVKGSTSVGLIEEKSPHAGRPLVRWPSCLASLSRLRSLVRAEEKQLVSEDWAAEAAAKLIPFQLIGLCARRNFGRSSRRCG